MTSNLSFLGIEEGDGDGGDGTDGIGKRRKSGLKMFSARFS